MMLLLDVGNSALKWARAEGDGLADRGRLPLDQEDLDGALEQAVAKSWPDASEPQRILIASVAAEEMSQRIAQWCTRQWGVEPETVRASARAAGVTNAYREPGLLGVDRWLTLLAARARSPAPACVVDCGTAVTVDVMDAQGTHLGGLIVPGLAMMSRSLASCAQVRLDAEPDSEAPLLARDTVNAVRGGTLYAAVAFIDRVLADVETELEQPVQRMLTGGDARTILPLLRHPFEYVPDLVLEGLSVLAKEPACV